MNQIAGIDTGFVLPHWAYWGGLLIIPIILIIWSYSLEKKQKKQAAAPPEYSNGFTKVVDWVCEHTGQIVGFWTVIAVVCYTYEVIARYIFNKPTIWAQEAAYLIFGMQYVIAGAYTYLYKAHVAVDILYVKLPTRGQRGMDIFCSLFSMVFAVTLIGTCYGFFTKSLAMKEITVETWQIQYYPVKGLMMVGGILMLLALFSKLYKDIKAFNQLGRES
jgi:TRAP-type mannitol/chloroaromatic compound transport system permease small subunit